MIPDKLVTAAARQIHYRACLGTWPCDGCQRVARESLAAAFAALPECEESQAPWDGVGVDGPEFYGGWAAALDHVAGWTPDTEGA